MTEKLTGSPEIEELIARHDVLLRQREHARAKVLLQDALVALYDESPISMNVIVVLDALALGCKEVEQFQEASVYLAQSLAIKKLLFGAKHVEIVTAMRRLSFCLEDDRARILRAKTKVLATELGITDHLEKFLLTEDDMAILQNLTQFDPRDPS